MLFLRMKIKLIVASFFIVFGAYAQEVDQLKVYDHKSQEGQTLKIYAENGLIALTAYQPNIIKITYLKTAQEEIDTSSLITQRPLKTNVRITQNLDDIFMTTDSLIVIINKYDFSIKFESRK
jgi:hypothetical protein